jgi:hypothetical protein
MTLIPMIQRTPGVRVKPHVFPMNLSWAERGGDRLMRELMVKGEMTADDPRKKHFALSLQIMEIALRLADVGFRQRGIRALVYNTRSTEPEYRSCQICFFA